MSVIGLTPLNRAARRRADRDDERKQQQLLAWRTEFAHTIGKIEDENKQLRNVCRDFLYALHEYADGQNWAVDSVEVQHLTNPRDRMRVQWLGEGDGPDLARKALRMKPEGEPAIEVGKPVQVDDVVVTKTSFMIPNPCPEHLGSKAKADEEPEGAA